MKKKFILKENDSFNLIINEGYKRTNEYFIVYFVPSIFLKKETPKFGISVGKKLGGAPLRNKYKRIIRSIIRNNFELAGNKCYVIMLRPRAIGVKYDVLEQKLISILKEIHEI